MNVWVDQLQLRVASFRKEKTSWTAEAVSLRGEVKDAKVGGRHVHHIADTFGSYTWSHTGDAQGSGCPSCRRPDEVSYVVCSCMSLSS